MSVLGQELINIVRAKAAENPSFVYQSPLTSDDGYPPPCVYVFNGCPSCLIGHALFDAGVINRSIESGPRNSQGFAALADSLELEVDTDEWKWLRQVQRYQDSHISWGEAVKKADRAALDNYGMKTWNVA